MDHTASNIHTFEQVGLNIFFSIIILLVHQIINITIIITIIIITVVDSCTNVMIITF